VFGQGKEFPTIDAETSDFRYVRIMESSDEHAEGFTKAALDGGAKKVKAWAKTGDVFFYFISGAKVRGPAAAMALLKRVA
jgi:uncharacterized protein YecE (DUF72 family)